MVYLDNAATSRKKPFSVYLTILKETLLSANPGRGGHRAALSAAMKIEEVRSIVRKRFMDGEVVFTKNCTEALNLAFTARLTHRKVITTSIEHNSVLRPLKRMETMGKIDLIIVDPTVEAFSKAVDRATGMVVIGAVSNVTGKKSPVEEICDIVRKKSDALIVIDGAQSAGKIDIDLKNADMFATSGHKALLGTQGTGFLIVKRGVVLEPLITGGTGSSGAVIDVPKDIPEGMEAGTLNGPGIIALGKAIEYAFRRKKKIVAKENACARLFVQLLSKEKRIVIYSCQNGVVLCNVKGLQASEAADVLSVKYRVYVRSGLHCAPLMHKKLGTLSNGAIRISFGNNNNFIQVLYAAYALKKICRERNGKSVRGI